MKGNSHRDAPQEKESALLIHHGAQITGFKYLPKKSQSLVKLVQSKEVLRGFPGGSVVKNPPANARDAGLTPGSGLIPSRRKWQSTPVFLPEKSHGQRNLVGCSSWGLIKSDRT